MIFKKRSQKLKIYARDFCDTVRRDYAQAQLTKENPIIKFYRNPACATLNIDYAETTTGGEAVIDGYYENGKIEIYNVSREKPYNLRETIRHECLHFMLDKSGLPFRDHDDLFLALAIKYNAKPWGILDNPEKWGLDNCIP